MSEERNGFGAYWGKRLFLRFIIFVPVLRLLTAFNGDGDGFVAAEWLDLRTWIAPVIFSLLFVFAFYMHNRKEMG